MKLKYYILFIFFGANLFSQNKTIEEQCKSKYDSIFRDFFGDKFFKKNIQFDKDQYSLRVDTMDYNNEDYNTSFAIYINKITNKL